MRSTKGKFTFIVVIFLFAAMLMNVSSLSVCCAATQGKIYGGVKFTNIPKLMLVNEESGKIEKFKGVRNFSFRCSNAKVKLRKLTSTTFVLEALKPGKARIIIKYLYKKKRYKRIIKVTVKNSDLKINKNLNLCKGKKKLLNVKYKNKSVKQGLSISVIRGKNIVSVNGGKITAKNDGEAKIAVKYSGKKAYCNIKVSNHNWADHISYKEENKDVLHDAEYEEVEETSEKRCTKYKCIGCKNIFDSIEDFNSHTSNNEICKEFAKEEVTIPAIKKKILVKDAWKESVHELIPYVEYRYCTRCNGRN